MFFSFLAGIVTILSPCILPVAPVIFSASLSKGKSRPFGILFGFILGFSLFTLFLSFLVEISGVSASSLRLVAVLVLFVLGLVLIFPSLGAGLKKLSMKLLALKPKKKSEEKDESFWGGVVIGLSLGLVWTPCAGPILASVVVLSATAGVSLNALLIIFAYSIGTALPMMAIIFGGRALLYKLPSLTKNLAKIQVGFGFLVVLTAAGIYFGWDRGFQTFVLDKFPGYGSGLTQIEELEIVENELKKLTGEDETVLDDSVCELGMAPEIEGVQEWLNSESLSMEALRGKVVLIDFWTYSCINCIRTLPFIEGWHEKYVDDGLVIIGVHTPEFEFEKDVGNVRKALEEYNLQYPVVQDNDYKVWRSYNNRYWPAKYLIDKEGCIRYTHFGEGEYEETEEWIQKLLMETGSEPDTDLLGLDEYEGGKRTHETYLGYGRMDLFGSLEEVEENVEVEYTTGFDLDDDFFAYEGPWTVGYESAVGRVGSNLYLDFTGQEVYLVMNYNPDFYQIEELKEEETNVLLEEAIESVEEEGAEEEEEVVQAIGAVKLYLDGEELPVEYYGEDVDEGGTVQVYQDRLYRLIKFSVGEDGELVEGGELKIEVLTDGIEVFAFTFG